MNDSAFKFIAAEIDGASGDAARLRQLRAIEGYLKAAKRLRNEFDVRRGGGYADVPDFIDRFDVDCARVAP